MSRREALASMGTSASAVAEYLLGSAIATEDSIDIKLRATLPKVHVIASRALLRQAIKDGPHFAVRSRPQMTALLTTRT